MGYQRPPEALRHTAVLLLAREGEADLKPRLPREERRQGPRRGQRSADPMRESLQDKAGGRDFSIKGMRDFGIIGSRASVDAVDVVLGTLLGVAVVLFSLAFATSFLPMDLATDKLPRYSLRASASQR
mmetsp:Transcript_110513/g.307860  ORF Transcript_110513/g.307860 Transcript_110513/m.307860 type:complete len:128 (+) Transcript_110513:171-554(+)